MFDVDLESLAIPNDDNRAWVHETVVIGSNQHLAQGQFFGPRNRPISDLSQDRNDRSLLLLHLSLLLSGQKGGTRLGFGR